MTNKEFKLSEKEHDDEDYEPFYFKSDVKEFIKKLKEKLCTHDYEAGMIIDELTGDLK